MNLKEKKIYFIISPHINYYHSYRGDSRGITGFGKDLKQMRAIVEKLDEIEDMGYSFGDMRVTWDYADTFWSIQLQKEYQREILDRVIERCKKGKDEVLIGSWGNVAQPILDTEEFIKQHQWYLENSMGIGLNQLFSGRIAPYVRTQECMFTQGMIELYNKLDVKGICLYYSMYPFDTLRPFLYPRLEPNQRYGLIKLNSSISKASTILIPTYGFGDVIDFFSIKRWFKIIRKMQEQDKINEHALLFFNYDMDYNDWIGHKLPKFIQWMPKTRGLNEFAEVVDELEYVEFANLIDLIPKLNCNGERTLYPDVADGNWNGFYNWAQKYDNTKFWTVAQRARWLKCISDTLKSQNLGDDQDLKIKNILRGENDKQETYLRNKLLFASTTNFGMSMPFQHPHRTKTAMRYGLKAFEAAHKAALISIDEMLKTYYNHINSLDYFLFLNPIINRGISKSEKVKVKFPLFIKTRVPRDLSNSVVEDNKNLILSSNDSNNNEIRFKLYQDIFASDLTLEGFINVDNFKEKDFLSLKLSLSNSPISVEPEKSRLIANKAILKNEMISIEFDQNGKMNNFKYDDEIIGCSRFLESSITFGKLGNKINSKIDIINILRDGSDGFSASLEILSKFEIIKGEYINCKKVLTLYSNIPVLFVNVSMNLCDIKGESCSVDGTSYVRESYDKRWQEISPCEIRPNLIGNGRALRIWKKNFFGHVSYFDLDMKKVDSRNADIDCLVANISDGWMAISDLNRGILVGFNSLKSANFAFSPIKIRDKGFGDSKKKGQQVRINPFGTYYGKLLRYWTEGSGHAEKITKKVFLGTDHSTAPTFSNKEINFELIIIPYNGDKPPLPIQSFADHISLPPLIIIGNKDNPELINNYSKYGKIAEKLKIEYDIEKLMNMNYMEWVREINKDFDPNHPEKIPTKSMVSRLGVLTLLKMLIDGIRGR
ncbi:MAG: hypothetical protein ACFE8L_00645 [Candidatus Hodarchaeota archaeon]